MIAPGNVSAASTKASEVTAISARPNERRWTGRPLGVILAGGAASRMGGRPKGTLRVDGRRVLDRVYEAMQSVAEGVILVSGHEAAERWLPGVAVIPDRRMYCGALGGLHAALTEADRLGAPGVCIAAWDMPFVTAGLLAQLRLRGCGALAALPVHAGGRTEPLCAWYATGCLTMLDQLLEQGERRAHAFAERVEAVLVPVTELGGDIHMFTNINTPDDLLQARRRVRSARGVALHT